MDIINKVGQYHVRPWQYTRPQSDIKYLTIHHSASRANDNEESMLNQHMLTHVNGNGWPGLSYHYVIAKSGNVYQINKLTDVTWHDGKNFDSIGILLDGYFHGPINENPSLPQLSSLQELLNKLRTDLNLDLNSVVYHGERMATACCGDLLKDDVVKYRNQGNITQPNNFDYSLYKKNNGIYLQSVKNPPTGRVSYTVTRIQTEGTNHQEGSQFNAVIDFSKDLNGQALVADITEEDKIVYQINILGTIKHYDNREVKPVTPPEEMKPEEPEKPNDNCLEYINQLERAKTENESLNKQVKEFRTSLSRIQAEKIGIESDLSKVIMQLDEAKSNLNEAKAGQTYGLAERIFETGEKEGWSWLKIWRSLMRDSYIQTIIGSLITLAIGFVTAKIETLQPYNEVIVTSLLTILGIQATGKQIEKLRK